MNVLRLITTVLLLSVCSLAQAGEAAYTVRSTDLKAKPYTDADTLTILPERSKVEIVGRHGSWDKVMENGKIGWVKMLSLRIEEGVQSKTGDNGFKTLFNVASTGSSGSTMTTGVRGLSEENLRNPHPNPKALQELNGVAASKAEAQQFAGVGKLTTAKMNYLPAPAN
jgi:hypothetical protein